MKNNNNIGQELSEFNPVELVGCEDEEAEISDALASRKFTNIFKFGIYRHTPKYWFSNIAQFFRNIKYAFQRATRGFADPDWWEFDTFVATILRDGCRELAKKHYGCPSGIGGRNTEESSRRWEDILNKTADCFNAYLDKDFLTIPDNAETASDYLEVFAESCRVAEEEYLHGIEMLKDWHSHLWD